jgi:hypothetical protein
LFVRSCARLLARLLARGFICLPCCCCCTPFVAMPQAVPFVCRIRPCLLSSHACHLFAFCCHACLLSSPSVPFVSYKLVRFPLRHALIRF